MALTEKSRRARSRSIPSENPDRSMVMRGSLLEPSGLGSTTRIIPRGTPRGASDPPSSTASSWATVTAPPDTATSMSLSSGERDSSRSRTTPPTR